MKRSVDTNISSLKKLCNWSNWLWILFSLFLCVIFFLLYWSYSFICRNFVESNYSLQVWEELPLSYIVANNWCSLGDISILWIAVIIILWIFIVTQMINSKKGNLTIWNFVIMFICYFILMGLLGCFLYGEYSLILK